MNAIECSKLSKKFKSYKKEPGLSGAIKSVFQRNYIEKYAVESFQLEIKQGEIVALLGPNGAGKTTLMKMFTGIIVPTDGSISVLGHTPFEREKDFRKKIALVMGQKSQLWWDIPAMDSLLLLRSYYEIPFDEFNKKVKEMSHILQVSDILHIHVRKLSLGERMKLELMASLLHSPEIIFLDEPTIGLDLIAQESIRNFILNYHQENKATIILTSHYMADVKSLCKKLVLIMNGKKEFDGTIHKFENLLGEEKSISFSFSNPLDKSTKESSLFIDYKAKWNQENSHVKIQVPENKIREVSTQILEKYPVIDFSTEKLPIEKVMKELMSNPDLLTSQK